VVIVLAIGPKVRGFKPGRGQWFSRAIKVRTTSLFWGVIKPSAPCRKFYDILKNTAEYGQYISSAKFTVISRRISHDSVLSVSACTCQRPLVYVSGMIRTQMRTHRIRVAMRNLDKNLHNTSCRIYSYSLCYVRNLSKIRFILHYLRTKIQAAYSIFCF
jgi:hypothetical protein